MLFSHGTRSAGLAPIDRWRSLLDRARDQGRFLGVDPNKYPKDFGVFGRYHDAAKTIPARFPIPGSFSMDRLDAFLARMGDRYPVAWAESRDRAPDRTGSARRP